MLILRILRRLPRFVLAQAAAQVAAVAANREYVYARSALVSAVLMA